MYDNITVHILGTVYSYVNCFFKYQNEYSGNSFGSIVIVIYLCSPGMFENIFFESEGLNTHCTIHSSNGQVMDLSNYSVTPSLLWVCQRMVWRYQRS